MNHATTSTIELLTEVNQLHRDRKFIKAADILLDFLICLLEEDRMSDIDELLSLLKITLRSTKDEDLYDDNGLARIHTILALTLRSSQRLPLRTSLRTAYRDVVQRREGKEASMRAVKHL